MGIKWQVSNLSKLLNAYFNDETLRCQAEIASKNDANISEVIFSFAVFASIRQ